MVRTSNRTIDLVCQCDYDYENELFKSTYENISEDMWYPLDSASERDYYVILNNWWKKNSYVNKIAKKAESIVKIPGYDYISLVRGMVCLLAGIIICVVIPVGTGENSVFSYSMTVICLKIFMILQAIRGLLYIIPYTQERIKIFEWRCGKRFIFEDSSTIEGSKYSPKSLWDFERKNGVVLNSESIEFYYKTGLRSVNYKDCASIFETDNLFVIMIQNNCIASFQKCNMTSSQQACVREWFSPYYKKE